MVDRPEKVSQFSQESKEIIIQIIRTAAQRMNHAGNESANQLCDHRDEIVGANMNVVGQIPIRFTQNIRLTCSKKSKSEHED